jgi:hypothetical protein
MRFEKLSHCKIIPRVVQRIVESCSLNERFREAVAHGRPRSLSLPRAQRETPLLRPSGCVVFSSFHSFVT